MKNTLPLLFTVSLLALTACSLSPEAITPAEHAQRAQEDYKVIADSYVAVQGPMTLESAIARALKYNYDAQLSKIETSLQERQLDLALSQMLPHLAADAGYNWRGNVNASESVSVFTKQQSLEPSYSEQRVHDTADLQFSWNLLDLGVSYFQARQQGYRALIAVERRRKVINGLVKDVQASYWKAVAANELLPKVDATLKKATAILEASRKAHDDKAQPPLVALDFQQNMLQIVSQLRRMRNDLNSAKVQLATLTNAPLSTPLTTVPPANLALSSRLKFDTKQLEQLSLMMRPELREEAYQEKVSRQDVYKEIIKIMPGVTLLSGLNYDSNKYMYNDVWDEVGARVTLNLMSVVQGPQAIKAAEAGVDVAHARRMALSAAVLSQVNVSYQQYSGALDNLGAASEVNKVQVQIMKNSDDGKIAQTQSDAEQVRRSLTAMVAELELYRSVTELHTSLANLYSSIGVDIIPPTVEFDDLDKLTAETKVAIVDWEEGRLPKIDAPAPEASEQSAPVAGSDDPASTTR